MSEHAFGQLSSNEDGYGDYKEGDWIKYDLPQRTIFARLKEFRPKEGELIFDAELAYTHNERGYVLDIVENKVVTSTHPIQRHQKSSIDEVKDVIENQSMFYKHWDKYVKIPGGDSMYMGRLDKIFRDRIELLPAMNFDHEGNPYVEEKDPVSIKAEAVSKIIPSSKKALENIVKKTLGEKDSEIKSLNEKLERRNKTIEELKKRLRR